jgi:uncharacterized protein (DUF1684 family)
MTDHDHHHVHDWQSELVMLREAAARYYLHEFDWRGHGPPEGFDGPRYFPPAPEWRLLAQLDTGVPGAGDHAEIATSNGQLRHMHVAGQLVFESGGSEQRLTAFVSQDAAGDDVLFVPFRDATSGNETYGAGRYVEAAFDPDSDSVELDFNYAYNPSCVYSPTYDCPFPPPQNRLPIAVRAGEMLPFEKPAA